VRLFFFFLSLPLLHAGVSSDLFLPPIVSMWSVRVRPSVHFGGPGHTGRKKDSLPPQFLSLSWCGGRLFAKGGKKLKKKEFRCQEGRGADEMDGQRVKKVREN